MNACNQIKIILIFHCYYNMSIVSYFIVTSFIGFPDPDASCEQSDVTVSIPVVRTQGTVGKVVVPWRAVSAPGKSKSRYEGTNDVLVFKDNEDRKSMSLF